MTPRLTALACVAAAALVWGFVAQPLRREASGLADEYRRLRDERREVESRGRAAARSAALEAAVLKSAASRGGSLRELRQAALGCLKDSGLGEVRLGVKQGTQAGVAGHVRIQATGPFDKVVHLTGRLTRPPVAFLLDHVSFTPRGDSVDVVVEATGLGGGS